MLTTTSGDAVNRGVSQTLSGGASVDRPCQKLRPKPVDLENSEAEGYSSYLRGEPLPNIVRLSQSGNFFALGGIIVSYSISASSLGVTEL